ncbi:MAG: hypothetical protein KIS68_16285 [Bauldia sp.]|nr:hypothetical protein [Bauldia sp.]
MRRAVALAVLVICAFTLPSAAAQGDMRLGSFTALWCNYNARIDIQSREGTSWIFHGRILIEATGQYDRIWIEQYSDNSLRMVRYLEGANAGATQTIQTHPPQTSVLPNRGPGLFTTFASERDYGFGCEGTRSWIIIPEG